MTLAGLVADIGRLMAWAHLRRAGQQGAGAVDEMQSGAHAIALARFAVVDAAGSCATQVVADPNVNRAACDAGALAT